MLDRMTKQQFTSFSTTAPDTSERPCCTEQKERMACRPEAWSTSLQYCERGSVFKICACHFVPPKTANVIGFLVAKHGPHDWIKASETFAIRNLRPNGNAGQCPGRERHRKRGRGRPPQAIPAKTKAFFLERCRTSFQQKRAKSETAGPVNIYSIRRGCLLALWACSWNSVLSLPLLDKGRSPQNAVVR